MTTTTREECPNGRHNYPSSCSSCGYNCKCSVTPREYHHVHYGITEPGSAIQLEPDCPEHGEGSDAGEIPDSFREQVDKARATAIRYDELRAFALARQAEPGIAEQLAARALAAERDHGADGEGFISAALGADAFRRRFEYTPTRPRRRGLIERLRKATRRR